MLRSSKEEQLKNYISTNSIYDSESDIDNYRIIFYNLDFLYDFEEFDFNQQLHKINGHQIKFFSNCYFNMSQNINCI